ncbi:MAG: DUF1801 domain-containing protein [Bacteroidota bacterium]
MPRTRNIRTATIIPAKRSKEVDLYLKRVPKHQRELMTAVREIILKTIPDAVESIKYTVPFYTRLGLLCYLNPLKGSNGIYIGFAEGCRMSDPSGILTGKHLKQIRYMEFRTRSAIKVRLIKEYLHEAVMLNELKQHPFPL